MRPSYITQEKLHKFIQLAIDEDVGDGDHSSLASISSDARNKAQLFMKDTGVISGLSLAEDIFHYFNADLDFHPFYKDGNHVQPGDVLFSIEGSSQSILTAERLVLNCMQRMSGISTYTNYLSSLIEGSNARLLDTRKTTPNFRMLEKWAVLIGGGHNHRFGLYDMIMLKDNHIDFAGSITKAVEATINYLEKTGKSLSIEVEVRNMNEVKEALETGYVNRIMLDNMSVSELKEAVKHISGRVETEASGGITEKTIREVAYTGVDFISVGALTHSIKSLDMSLKASY